MKKRIELLAPAGSSESLHAAVENGADAVYLGGKLFSARQQADNFDIAVLREELEYAHTKGVSIYLTMNTLVSDEEMKKALIFAAEAREAGIDGIIVQDLGLAAALRRVMPDVPLHGSTQMTIYDVKGAQALEEMGFKRVVLAREVPLKEAAIIAKHTQLEVEVFVHGALCICYSGQCLMSSIIGGRSGNRGRCAQPCRLPYKLVGSRQSAQREKTIHNSAGSSNNAGNHSDIKGARYLLSPKDICSLEHLTEIVDSGVRSLKIEGRMKSPEYVATVVRIYRKYLDLALTQEQRQIDDNDMHDLLQIYNRGGFSSGYMQGRTGADMMSFKKPNNSGIYLGNVIAYDETTQTISTSLEDKLSIGDGIEIWTGGFNSPGGIVRALTTQSKGDIPQRKRNTTSLAEVCPLTLIGNFRGGITPGMEIYKTSDIELNKIARDSFTGKNVRRIEISGQAALMAGQPLQLKVEDQDGNTASVMGTVPSETAINKAMTQERLKDQLSRTGSTPFIFSKLQIELEEGLSLPISEINEVRRQALENLIKLRIDRYTGLRSNEGISGRIEEVLKCSKPTGADGKKNISEASISLFFYKWEQKINYESLGADRVYLPFVALDKPGFKETAAALREKGTEVFAWLPPVARGNCEKLIDKFVEKGIKENASEHIKSDSYGVDGILVGNIGTVQSLKEKSKLGLRLAGDISMNLFNALSVKKAMETGLESVVLSIELTKQQIGELIKHLSQFGNGKDAAFSMPSIEAAVYGRLPIMTSEYCPVGCAEGSSGITSGCSGACSNGDYNLRDRMGMEFPVLCDRLDCRSTILNSNVLFVPDSLRDLRAAGVDIFRLYVWDEAPDVIKELVQLYRASSIGDSEKAKALHKGLVDNIKATGFTKGHYYRGV